MNYDEQIEALEKQQQALEDEILKLMELQYAESHDNDISVGDNVLVQGDIYATVTESEFVAANFYGDRMVRHIITCKTPSGKVGEVLRCEVVKLNTP